MSDAEDETKEQRGVSYADNFFAKDESGFNVEIVAATHVGRVRRRNEDHYAVIRRDAPLRGVVIEFAGR